jgi:hypothetical protein
MIWLVLTDWQYIVILLVLSLLFIVIILFVVVLVIVCIIFGTIYTLLCHYYCSCVYNVYSWQLLLTTDHYSWPIEIHCHICCSVFCLLIILGGWRCSVPVFCVRWRMVLADCTICQTLRLFYVGGVVTLIGGVNCGRYYCNLLLTSQLTDWYWPCARRVVTHWYCCLIVLLCCGWLLLASQQTKWREDWAWLQPAITNWRADQPVLVWPYC